MDDLKTKISLEDMLLILSNLEHLWSRDDTIRMYTNAYVVSEDELIALQEHNYITGYSEETFITLWEIYMNHDQYNFCESLKMVTDHE